MSSAKYIALSAWLDRPAYSCSRLMTRCNLSYKNETTTIQQPLPLNYRVEPRKHKTFCITCIQRRPNVFDVGPTLDTCYTNVLCLLGALDEQ